MPTLLAAAKILRRASLGHAYQSGLTSLSFEARKANKFAEIVSSQLTLHVLGLSGMPDRVLDFHVQQIDIELEKELIPKAT